MMDVTAENQSKKPSREEEILELAKKELLREIKCASIRAEQFGAHSWAKPQKYLPSKRFLKHMLVNASRDNDRKEFKSFERRERDTFSARGFSLHSKYTESNRGKTSKNENIRASSHSRHEENRRRKRSSEKEDRRSSSHSRHEENRRRKPSSEKEGRGSSSHSRHVENTSEKVDRHSTSLSKHVEKQKQKTSSDRDDRHSSSHSRNEENRREKISVKKKGHSKKKKSKHQKKESVSKSKKKKHKGKKR